MSNTRTSKDQSFIVNLVAAPAGQPVNQPQVVIQQIATLSDAAGTLISQMPVPMMAVSGDFDDGRLAAINVALATVGLVIGRAK